MDMVGCFNRINCSGYSRGCLFAMGVLVDGLFKWKQLNTRPSTIYYNSETERIFSSPRFKNQNLTLLTGCCDDVLAFCGFFTGTSYVDDNVINHLYADFSSFFCTKEVVVALVSCKDCNFKILNKCWYYGEITLAQLSKKAIMGCTNYRPWWEMHTPT